MSVIVVPGLCPGGVSTNDSPLTRREVELLRLAAEGASYTEIAARLFISLNTTKSHLRSVRQKLGATRTVDAAAIARREGWL